jgi:lysophospholipase L1-like esterase
MIESVSSYVAMGSSFAAGPRIGRRVTGSPREAWRSDHNYAHLVARRLGLELIDVTFSGATTADLRQPNELGFPAQLDALKETTQLVTLTCGGNDLGYIPYLAASSIPRPLTLLPRWRELTAALDTTQLGEKVADLDASLRMVCAEIRQRAPHARVLFTDYPALVPPEADATKTPLSDATASVARRIAGELSRVVEENARASGFDFVPVAEASRDHHAWAATPWTTHMTLLPWSAAPYHPTAAGMRAISELIVARLSERSAD